MLETCATFQSCVTSPYKRIAQLRFQHIHSASSIRTAEMALALRSVFLLCGLLAGVWALPKVTYCPKGWTQLDDSCFIFVNQQRTFIDAERICQLKGGNLASILDARENALVIELIRQEFNGIRDTWIGLHDAIQESTNLWTDGSVVGFTAYAASQPDNFGNEDCTEIDDLPEAWNDDTCTDLNYFVCVKDAQEH
ncbi:galactose-specific lectin nattectin-like [Hippocampus zosterae]|uniref:galactose-specific lectin nattectin-like n=1 Tax=Hippocampus zosterae TaxID=109293 RepID=UPI00223D8D17|nr:galactose-specific lectin nattectin-like [Hippocampus zosterae]